jgi:GcrA cell cycle regulator
MEWSVEAIDRLRTLWAEGLSTAEIGRRMGVSKNAVIGKAHRLNLPGRPSPIRRDPSAPRVAAAPGPLAQPAASCAPAAAPPRRAPAGAAGMATAGGAVAERGGSATSSATGLIGRERAAAPVARAAAAATAPPAAAVRSLARLSGTTRSCCWPIGEPGTPEFRFCGGDAMPGKPYCAKHAAVAYVRARDRREDAA